MKVKFAMFTTKIEESVSKLRSDMEKMTGEMHSEVNKVTTTMGNQYEELLKILNSMNSSGNSNPIPSSATLGSTQFQAPEATVLNSGNSSQPSSAVEVDVTQMEIQRENVDAFIETEVSALCQIQYLVV